MNLKYLLISILLGLFSFVLYRFHIWWLNGRDENEGFSEEGTRLGTVKNWVFIISCAILATVYLLKAIF